MTLDVKLILDEFNRRFDEWETRWDRRFSPPPVMELQDDPSSAVLARANSRAADDSVNALITSTDSDVLFDAVITDNWGGCFDDDEQYCAAPFVIADNWGGFFGGEDLDSPDGPTRFVTAELDGYDEIELDATTILDVLPGAHTVGKARCASYADHLYASASCTTPDQALNGHYTDKLLMLCFSNITSTMPTRCSTLVPTPTPMPEIVDGAHPQRQAPPSVSAAARKTPDDLELGLPDYYGAGRQHPLTSRVVTLSYRVPELLLSYNSLEAKALLEAALMEANKERKKNITGTLTTKPNDDLDKDDDEFCLRGICLELACTMEVQDCGHQMMELAGVCSRPFDESGGITRFEED